MKKTIHILLALAFVLAFFGATTAKAQGGLTYSSGVQIANLEGTAADITLIYYSQETGLEVARVDDTIAANSSKTYFPLSGVDDGFNGSMVIESTTQVAAIANLITTDGSYGAATTGFGSNEISTDFSLPLVMCNNSGFNTFFNIQNAGTDDATVEIEYLPGSNGKSGVTESVTLKPGAAKTFDQTEGSDTKDCADLKDASGRFIGGAQITSDQPVVASVMQLNTGSFKILMGYNGFATGSPEISLPLVMANNSGFYTGIQIQNVGASNTNVTVDYAANTAGSFNPSNDTCNNLGPGDSCTFIQASGKWTGKYNGAAKITNSTDQNLVAIVNQVSPGGGGFGPFGTAYEGFDPAASTSNISTPLVMANNSGYYTGIQVQNVGDSACADITIDYGPNVAPGGTFNPVNEVFDLTAGTSKTIIQDSIPSKNGGNNDWTGKKYIGSAQITAPEGCSIVAIVNEVAISSGDKFFTYDGFNK